MPLVCKPLLLHAPDCMRLLVTAPRGVRARLPMPVVLARGRTDLAIPLEPGDDLWLCGGLFTEVHALVRGSSAYEVAERSAESRSACQQQRARRRGGIGVGGAPCGLDLVSEHDLECFGYV